MRISFKRHGDWNRGTGSLTSQAQTKASALSRAGKYDMVFSSPVCRCVETAEYLGRGEFLRSHEVFAEFLPGDDVKNRMFAIIGLIRYFMKNGNNVLVVTHSNLVSALKLFNGGKEIPENLDDLPEIQYLEGFDINI